MSRGPSPPHGSRRAAIAAVAAGLLAAAALAGCDAGAPAGHEVRIPLGAGGVGFLPLLVMKERGLIEQHARALGVDDLTVRWIDLGGPAVMNDALLAGSVDFIAAGPPAFITLWDRTRGSADVRGVAAMTSLPMYLNTSAPNLHKLEDLTDRDKIAVTAVKVSIPAIAMQMYAAEHFGAAEAGRFDRYTVTMTHPDALIALLAGSGQIDAHFTSPPFFERERKDPRIHTVISTDDILGGSTTFTMLSTTGRYRAANPKIYAAVLAALRDANDLIRRDPDAAAAMLYKAEPTAGFSVEEIAGVLRDPAIKFTTTPENVMKYAAFMHSIGTIEHEPASWQDLFFPEIHDAPGS